MSGSSLAVVARYRDEVAPALRGHPAFRVVVPALSSLSAEDRAAAGGVVVTGSCGALRPGVRPGTVVLPPVVRHPGGAALAPDPHLLAALRQAAAARGIPLEEAELVQADAVVDSAADRVELAAAAGAAFVDLESAARAVEARELGLPWVVLRYVTDTPERRLDWLALLLGGWPQASPSPARVLAALARRPWLAPRLLGLARVNRAGSRSVASVLLGATAGLRPRREAAS